MDKWTMPEQVNQGNFNVEWDYHTYQTIGSDKSYVVPGYRSVKIEVKVPATNRSKFPIKVRLMSSTGFVNGMITFMNRDDYGYENLTITLQEEFEEFVHGMSDWVMIQYFD